MNNVVPIRASLKRAPADASPLPSASVRALEDVAVRALAALMRLRDCSNGGDLPIQVIDFAGFDTIPWLREAAIQLNADIDAFVEKASDE